MRKIPVTFVALAIVLGVFCGSDRRASSATDPTQAVSVGPGTRYICQTSAPAPTGRARTWVRCSDGHLIFTSAANADTDVSSPSVSVNAYATVQDEGGALTQRNTINFAGTGVTCADDTTRTTCTIPGASSLGNWTFSGNNADVSSGAATVGGTSASSAVLGGTCTSGRTLTVDSSGAYITMGGGGVYHQLTAAAYLPVNGVIALGGASNVFTQAWVTAYATKNGGALTSGSSISPTAGVHHVTGTAAISTINLPYTGFVGSIVLIPDGAFTTGTSGNIALASTAVVNKALTMTYDGTKWYPSY